MTYIIIKQPHPLDKIWTAAFDAIDAANDAMDELGSDFTDEELKKAGDLRTEAIMAIMALPARNLSDSIYKLDLAGIDGGTCRDDCDMRAIMNEATDLLDVAISRGRKLKSELSDTSTGVEP